MTSKDGAEEQKDTKMHSATQGVAIQASGPLYSDRLRAHEGGPRAVVKTGVFELLLVIFSRHALSRDKPIATDSQKNVFWEEADCIADCAVRDVMVLPPNFQNW